MIPRVITAIIAIPVTWRAVFAAGDLRASQEAICAGLNLLIVSVAVLLITFTAAGHIAVVRRHIASEISWGLIVGMIAGAIGCVTPVLVSGSAQGPLLGALVAGPARFVVGAIGGALYQSVVISE